jgi:phage gp29-like protein
MLVDQFGQNIKESAVMTDEVATIQKDIDVFYGWIKRLENPDPVLRSEAAGKGLKLYDEVERDAHAGSVLQQRIMAIVGKEWEITSAKSAKSKGRPASTTQEQVIADYVADVLMNCNFDQARQELLKAILYGFYNAEIMWKVANGNVIAISKIMGKHPRRFSFTAERELRLLTLQNMIEGEVLPDRKFITFTYGDSDNPYGKGLGQRLWWPVWFKKNGVKFWMIFLDKFGMPTPVGKYPPGTLSDKQNKLMQAVKAIQTDTGIIMPDNQNIEFLEASRAGNVSHEQLCKYMDAQISKAVLGQTASTEGTPGKLGNDQMQNEVRQEIIEADADLLDGCLNDSLIKWIVDYNFPNVTAYPKIKTYANSKPDLTAKSAIDKTLVVDIGLPVAVDYFYETYGIPAPQAGDVLVIPVKPASPFGAQSPANAGGIQDGKQFAEKNQPDWRATYMEALKPSLQNARTDALDKIETYLSKQTTPPTDTEFTAALQGILGASFELVAGVTAAATIADMYKTFRGPIAGVGFGGPDIRSMDFLSKLDNFYISKWIQNPDAVATVKSFLNERYLQDGGGLFGRQNPDNVLSFRDLFDQKLADLEDWQVSRIIDTSVTRVQNWAAVNQYHEAGIAYVEIYEPTHECDFCAKMNGQKISVETAYGTMTRQMGLTPAEFSAELSDKANAPTIENIDTLLINGILPPYHPHCTGIVIKHIGGMG